jgi:hypothetical protein
MSAKAFSSRLIFSPTAVERRSILGNRSGSLSAIVGRREYVLRDEHGSTRYLRLEFGDGSSTLDFGKGLYVFDDAFWRWFNDLPDLDARDKEVHKDSNFGLV